MVSVARINQNTPNFPPTQEALQYPNGLLAIGGDLSPERLLLAYERGIFPWYEDPQPIMWWSPDPRSVLYPDQLHISRSLRKAARRSAFTITSDMAFHWVLSGCAGPRETQSGTWITNTMGRAYMALHERGYAHSIEVWDENQQLAGGLYGVALNGVFFGESMFSHRENASKLALIALSQHLIAHNYRLIDCQIESEHLNSMGAKNIARLDFEEQLLHTGDCKDSAAPWRLELNAGDLL